MHRSADGHSPAANELLKRRETDWRYPGWRVVVIASLAMVATLPGRTVGLGLINETLLADLQVTRVHYANLTFWATILGALFSPLCGRVIDRWGVRNTLSVVTLCMAVITITMSLRLSAANLLLFLILSRGFGQSALSTASVTTVGKWFVPHLGIALGVFSALVALGFATAIPIVGSFVTIDDWRSCWLGVGVSLLLLAAASVVLIPGSHQADREEKSTALPSLLWREAMQTPAFWMFTMSTAVYYFVLSGLTLFSEAVLVELGFERSIYITAMASMMGAGLLGNFLAGWLAARWRVNRLLAISLLLLVVVLFGLPRLETTGHVLLLFALYGVCGGAFAVLFFAGYGQAFGQGHLGKIQGTAQALGVIASALGPKVLAETEAATGSYLPVFQWVGLAAILLVPAAWWTPMPARTDPAESQGSAAS